MHWWQWLLIFLSPTLSVLLVSAYTLLFGGRGQRPV